MKSIAAYVVATVMISDFGLGKFSLEAQPDRAQHVYQPTDMTSFWELWFVAAQVFTDYWKRNGIPGWIEVGVHMWTADSDVDGQRLMNVWFNAVANDSPRIPVPTCSRTMAANLVHAQM